MNTHLFLLVCFVEGIPWGRVGSDEHNVHETVL